MPDSKTPPETNKDPKEPQIIYQNNNPDEKEDKEPKANDFDPSTLWALKNLKDNIK